MSTIMVGVPWPTNIPAAFRWERDKIVASSGYAEGDSHHLHVYFYLQMYSDSNNSPWHLLVLPLSHPGIIMF
jgi:hypothetical protein